MKRVFPATVLQDCNEISHHHQYRFEDLVCDEERGGGDLVVPTKSANLLWGDYTLAGMESSVCIERKTLNDLFGTLGGRRDEFQEQIRCMAESYKTACVVVEASWADVILSPPSHSSMNPKSVQRTILAWWHRYPTVAWHFWGPRVLAEKTVFRLLERCYIDSLPEKERKRVRYPAESG